MATDKPDTIGWSLGIVFTFILTLAGTLYGMSKAGYRRVAGPAATTQPTATPPGVVGFFVDTLTYIPHILLLFGVLADMLTYQGVYSIPSLIGLISIPLNFAMKFFWGGVSDVFVKLKELFFGPVNPRAGVPGRNVISGGGRFFEDYEGCSIQGLGFLRNPYAPQTLVFTATVMFYYIFDLIQNRGFVNATAAIVLGGILFFAQAAVIGTCSQSEDEPGRGVQTFASFVEGMVFGGIGFSVVQSYFPGRLPSTAVSPFPKKTPEDLTPSASGGFKDKEGNPYVCLPNGQCYPDLSTKESRTAFADIAAANLGTGAPAVSENCSATPSTPSE